MQAWLCDSVGSLDGLRVADVPEPNAAPHQVVVKVHACALNFPDVLMVQGKYQRKPPLPFSPGCEFSGVVEDIGSGVTQLRRGDRVCGSVSYGALTEKIAVAAEQLISLPVTADMDEAAALLYTYSTSLYALRERGHLTAGDSLLVLGAGGGVGVAAVELAKVFGARVVAAASSDAKLTLARAKGADVILRYPAAMEHKEQQKAFGAQLKDAAGEKGFDVILDPIGGGYSEPALRSIGWQGRYLVVGFAAGAIPNIALNLPLLKGCQIVGVLWGTAATRDPRSKARIQQELVEMFANGLIRPHVAVKLDFERGMEGLKMLLERQAVGKIIVHC